MIKILLLGVSLAATTISSGAITAAKNLGVRSEKTLLLAKKPETNDSAVQTGQTWAGEQTVSFKGISFDYNQEVFGEPVWEDVPEQILEQETDKPDGVHPRHVIFTFKKRSRETPYKIAVFPIEDYRRVWKEAGRGHQEAFEAKLSAVRRAIGDSNYRINGEIPYLPFYDASQIFVARAKNLAFRSGDGVFFLTQFTQDAGNLVNNDELTLTYQGISRDEKHYVLADFPIVTAFLPNREADEYEGYKAPRTDEEFKNGEKSYRQYVAKMTARLEKLSPDEFEPGLRYFEEMISSLKIENTEK